MATEHEHRFTPFGQYFGRFGPQNVHYHPCIEVDDCDVVLVADTRGCEGPRTGTHRQEKLDGASDPSSEGRRPSAAVSGTGGSPNPEQATGKGRADLRKAWRESVRSGSDDLYSEFLENALVEESRAREEKLREAIREHRDAMRALYNAETPTEPDALLWALADGPSPSVPVGERG